MIAEQQQITQTVARDGLDDFLRRHFGPAVEHRKLGPIAVREDRTREYANAYGFSVNTTRFIESGDVLDGLMSGAIIVPKDGSPVHWAPTFLSTPRYLEEVAAGKRWWSSDGAAPPTEVRYYGIVTSGRTRASPSGVMRRRTAEGRTVEEVFARGLVWKPTDYFDRYDLGHNDNDHVEITEAEAQQFVERITAKLT